MRALVDGIHLCSRYDGKAVPAPYKAPAYTGPEPSAEVENGRICKRLTNALSPAL